ncbi:MAG: Uma2 family endonuclease, partial [Bryobacteraceae bacterium]
RIPDVAIFPRDPGDEVPSSPPLAAIEVLSPDDRVGYMTEKLEEYARWGVRHIWLADPERRKFFIYDVSGLHEADKLVLPEYDVTLTKTAIFEME